MAQKGKIMARITSTQLDRRAFAGYAGLLGMALLLSPLALAASATADEYYSPYGSDPVTEGTPDELEMLVIQTASAYNDAVAQRQVLEDQILEIRARIAEIEAQIPLAQDRVATAMRSLYKYQQNPSGLMALILESDSFSAFISTVRYLNAVQQDNLDQVQTLADLYEQYETERANLDAALGDAVAQEQAAAVALEQAEAARQEALRRAAERAAAEAAAARAAAEAAAAQAAAQEAAQEAARQTAWEVAEETGGVVVEDPESGEEHVVDPATGEEIWTEPEPDPVYEEPYYPDDPWGEEIYIEPPTIASDRNVFIAEWGARIDDYMYGFPLYGYGAVFAAAAWDYGIDPRFSPAISCIESTKGKFCFLPHNAWGWGHVSWDSWEEAIYAHAYGLATIYGYTVTWEGACMYCPPTAAAWYEGVVGQMAII